MKHVLLIFCCFCWYNLIGQSTSRSQFKEFKFAPEFSVDYNKSTNVICTANIFKINGAPGSVYLGMDNFGLGLGLSLRNKTFIPELVVNYTRTFYIFDFGLRSKFSLNGNEKYYLVSPTFGVSFFGFFGVFYSYNLGIYSPNHMSEHTIGARFLISNELWKKGDNAFP